MGAVDMWIDIHTGDSVPSGGPQPTLLHRELNMNHTPQVGDLIFIAKSDEDDEGAIGTYVYERFFGYTGVLILTMRPWHIDPTGLAVELVDGRHRAVWYNSEGDLITMLRDSGWEER